MNSRTRNAVFIGAAVIVTATAVATWLRSDAGAGDAATLGGATSPGQAMTAPEGVVPDTVPPAAGESTVAPLEVTPAPASVDATAQQLVVLLGKVVAPDDTPVEGAVLTPSLDERDAETLATETSGPDGRFRFTFDEMPRSMRVEVEAEGFSSMSMSGSGWGEGEVNVQLYWTTTAHGVVREVDTGAPIGGAIVSGGKQDVQTAADGSFALEGVSVGWQTSVSAIHADYAPASTSFLLTEPEAIELELQLQPGVPVEFTVVDRETGQPLAGAEVRRHQRGDAYASSDHAGRFTLRFEEGSKRSFVVTHDDYCMLSMSWDGDGATPDLAPRIPLLRYAWVDARVTDADGTPIDDADAYAWSDDADGRHELPKELHAAFGLPGNGRDIEPEGQGERGEDGVLHIPVMPLDATYSLHAYHKEFVSASSDPLELRSPGDRVWVDLVMRQGGSIRGKVLRNGRPADNVHLTCTNLDGGFLGRTHIDNSGEYLLENVRVGDVKVVIKTWRRRETLDEVTLTVEAGQEIVHDFLLEEELSTIEGRVTRVTGDPVPDAFVSVRYANVAPEQVDVTKTDEDGHYVLTVPPDATYHVSVRNVVSAEALDVAAGTSGVDLVLPLVGTFQLQLVEESTGEPVRLENAQKYRRWLSWRLPGDETFQWTFDAGIDIHGTTELELPVGLVDLAIHLESEGFESIEVSGVTVHEITPARPFVVTLRRGSDMAFQFVEAASGEGRRPADHIVFAVGEWETANIRESRGGEPVHRINGVSVWIGDPGLMQRRLPIPEDGAVRQRGLAPGRYVLLAFPSDLVLEPPGFTLPRTSDQPLEIAWRPRN